MFPTQALNIRAFRNLWLGQAISQVGDAFYYVVFMFMVKQITGSSAMVGIVGAAEMLPYLLFSAQAGVLADRMDRRRIMLLSDTISGLILVGFGVLASFATPPVWTLIATPFALSLSRVFFMPAKGAAIPAIVPEDMLMQANALSSMTQTAMPFLGLALSASILGLLYAISRQWFFVAAVLVNAVSFFCSAGYIRTLPSIVPQREEGPQHPWADFREGLRFIRHHRVLRVYIFLGMVMNLLVSPFFVVYVEANARWFGGKPQVLCTFEAMFFLGMVLGSMWVGKMNFRKVGLGYCYSLFLVGLGIAAMAYARSLWLFCTLNLLCGIVLPFCDIPLTTYFQVEVEDGFRGRVNSVLNMIRMGVMPVGMALGGIFVQRAGLLGAFLVMGLGMSVTALVGFLCSPFRTAEVRHQVKPQLEVMEGAVAS